jgi:hypothetical protein
MMDESSTKVLVTVAAMKLLLGRLYALTYKQLNLDPALVPEMHKLIIEKWSASTLVKSSDPVVSDVMSDEVLHEIESFLTGVEKDYQRMR